MACDYLNFDGVNEPRYRKMKKDASGNVILDDNGAVMMTRRLIAKRMQAEMSSWTTMALP